MIQNATITFDETGLKEYMAAIHAYKNADTVIMYSPIDAIGYGGKRFSMPADVTFLNEPESIKLLKAEIIELNRQHQEAIEKKNAEIEHLTKGKGIFR